MLVFLPRGERPLACSGPKGAPPAIPPIIITPYSYHTPTPAIDPLHRPPGPPLRQPSKPSLSLEPEYA